MKKKFFLVVLLLFVPLTVLAAAFTATVDNDHVVAGEGFVLQLSLSGATPNGDPDLGGLKQLFDVVGQAQTSDTTIINSVTRSSVGWQVTLIPKQTGRLTMPPITIDTDGGRLSTQPITVEVVGSTQKSSPTGGDNRAGNEVAITAAASISDPYQNQPIIYTVQMVAHANISDITLGDVTADDAIVQPQGKPEIKDEIKNGVPVKIVKIHYIVTPLKTKNITIAPVTMQGDIESAAPVEHPGGVGNGFMNPFAMLQGMGNFPDFVQSTPFSISSNAVVLNVKAPAVAMDPWLPLKGLQIKEKMDLSQGVKVGDPITRKFTLLAEGVVGSQLPSLEPQLNSTDFKVYADKPTMGESVNTITGNIVGSRDESYSIIPLKAGSLILPEIKVPWWDIKNNRIAYTEVPAHTVDVLPTPQTTNASPDVTQNQVVMGDHDGPVVQTIKRAALTDQPSWLWYGLIALLLVAFAAITFAAAYLQRKVSVLNKAVTADAENKNPAPINARPQARADINWDQIHTAEDLNSSLLAYAHDYWGTPRYASLETIFAKQQKKSLNMQEQEEIDAIVRDLTAALYAGKKIDLETIKVSCRHVIAAINRPANKRVGTTEHLPSLNPS